MHGTLRVTGSIVKTLVLAVLILSLSGCDAILNSPDRQLLEMKKDVVSSTLLANKTLLSESLKSGIIISEGSRSIETEDAGGLTEEEIDAYLDNPDLLIQDLLAEENGEAALNYLYTMIISNDSAEILEAARPLISEDEYLSIKEQTQLYESGIVRSLNSRGVANDTQAHIVGGMGVAFIGAALVYFAVPWFNCLSKVICLAVCIVLAGLFTAALAGMIKEYIDENDGDLTTFAEMRDFMNTLAGGIIGSVVSLLPMVLSNTTIAGILCAAAGIACLHESGVLKYIWDYLTQA